MELLYSSSLILVVVEGREALVANAVNMVVSHNLGHLNGLVEGHHPGAGVDSLRNNQKKGRGDEASTP